MLSRNWQPRVTTRQPQQNTNRGKTYLSSSHMPLKPPLLAKHGLTTSAMPITNCVLRNSPIKKQNLLQPQSAKAIIICCISIPTDTAMTPQETLETLQAMGLELPSPAYVFAVIVFSIIGMVGFYHGRKTKRPYPKWLGVALMLYPYVVYATWAVYLVGIVLCVGLFRFWNKDD
jgi:hypothetical protein